MVDEQYRQRFFAELEALGEDEVRFRLASGRYTNVNDRKTLAQEWLRIRERERQDAFNAEQLAIARDAAASARDAADSARETASEAREANKIAKRANKIAMTAIVAAIISAIISITSN